jgi:regulatory protein
MKAAGKIYNLDEAREAIRRFCALQERSHLQVQKKLVSYGLIPLAVDELLIELIQDGFLNEMRFAQAYARGKSRIKGWGERKIIYELRKHGVSEVCIASAISELDVHEINDKLKSLIRKKYASLAHEPPHIKSQKVVRYLLGKGYSYSEIKESLQSVSRWSDDIDGGAIEL